MEKNELSAVERAQFLEGERALHDIITRLEPLSPKLRAGVVASLWNAILITTLLDGKFKWAKNLLEWQGRDLEAKLPEAAKEQIGAENLDTLRRFSKLTGKRAS